MQFIKRLRPRTRRGAIIATVAVLTIGVGTAMAAYFLTGGSGSGSATLGTTPTGGQLQLALNFSNGLMPGGSEPVDVVVTNPSSSTYSLSDITETGITTSDPTNCPASDFKFTPTTPDALAVYGPVTIPGNSSWTYSTWAATYSSNTSWGSIKFVDDGSDQNGCSGATITISATAS